MATVNMMIDDIRGDVMWRAFWRDMDALAAEFDKPFYDRRPTDVIRDEVITLRNMIREIQPLAGLSVKTMEEMFDESGFTF